MITMDMTLFAGFEPETNEIMDMLVEKFNVSPNAERFSVGVDLRNGNIVCHVFYPTKANNE